MKHQISLAMAFIFVSTTAFAYAVPGTEAQTNTGSAALTQLLESQHLSVVFDAVPPATDILATATLKSAN